MAEEAKMPSLAVLQEVYDRAGSLRAVREGRFQGSTTFITHLQLVFDQVSLVVIAEPDLDTIAVRLEDVPEDPHVTVHDVTSSGFWAPAIGLELLWAWELKNHQGYCDGVRFSFSDNEKGISVEVEMIVVASALRLYRCHPLVIPAA